MSSLRDMRWSVGRSRVDRADAVDLVAVGLHRERDPSDPVVVHAGSRSPRAAPGPAGCSEHAVRHHRAGHCGRVARRATGRTDRGRNVLRVVGAVRWPPLQSDDHLGHSDGAPDLQPPGEPDPRPAADSRCSQIAAVAPAQSEALAAPRLAIPRRHAADQLTDLPAFQRAAPPEPEAWHGEGHRRTRPSPFSSPGWMISIRTPPCVDHLVLTRGQLAPTWVQHAPTPLHVSPRPRRRTGDAAWGHPPTGPVPAFPICGPPRGRRSRASSGLHHDRHDHRAALGALVDELAGRAAHVALQRLDVDRVVRRADLMASATAARTARAGPRPRPRRPSRG